MAADYLLVIDGVKGESKDSKHPGAIELVNWEWGAQNNGSSAHGSGGGTGKVEFQDFLFSAFASKASPRIMLACASGEHFAKAQLFARKQGGDQQDYYTLTVEDFIVTQYKVADSDPKTGVPIEHVAFNFAKVRYEYRPQKPDGTLDAPITGGWDVKRNKKQ